jgi:hypothetical protein
MVLPLNTHPRILYPIKLPNWQRLTKQIPRSRHIHSMQLLTPSNVYVLQDYILLQQQVFDYSIQCYGWLMLHFG